MQAAAKNKGTQATSAQSAEEAELSRGFVALTPLDVREASQFDDSLIWTPELIALRFRYYDGQAWVDEWDSRAQKALPVAVEIAMRFDATDGTHRPVAQSRTTPDDETSATTDRATAKPEVEDGDISDEMLETERPSGGSTETEETRTPIIRELVLLQPPTTKGKDEPARGNRFLTTTESQSR